MAARKLTEPQNAPAEIILAEPAPAPWEAAIAALLTGATQREAARAAGLTESQLSRLIQHDTRFRALYATQRAHVRRVTQQKAVELVEIAQGMLADLLADTQRDTLPLRARVALDILSLYKDAPPPDLPQTPDEAEQDEASGAALRAVLRSVGT